MKPAAGHPAGLVALRSALGLRPVLAEDFAVLARPHKDLERLRVARGKTRVVH